MKKKPRFHIFKDHTGRWGVIDRLKVLQRGHWAHSAHGTLSSAVDWCYGRFLNRSE